jgi:hypothetical protein
VVYLVREVCAAIWEVFIAKYLPVPSEKLLIGTATQHREKLNVSDCVGSIEGKHVKIKVFPGFWLRVIELQIVLIHCFIGCSRCQI